MLVRSLSPELHFATFRVLFSAKEAPRNAPSRLPPSLKLSIFAVSVFSSIFSPAGGNRSDEVDLKEEVSKIVVCDLDKMVSDDTTYEGVPCL